MKNLEIFAPQAQLEESANDRGKPEVPINWDVKRFGGSVFGPWFGGFQEQLLRRSGPKQEPGTASNPPNSVIFLVSFLFASEVLVRPFFDYLGTATKAISRKNTSKKGIQEQSLRRSGPISEIFFRSWTISVRSWRTCTSRSLALSSSCACGATCP